jgi:hypothetical protein
MITPDISPLETKADHPEVGRHTVTDRYHHGPDTHHYGCKVLRESVATYAADGAAGLGSGVADSDVIARTTDGVLTSDDLSSDAPSNGVPADESVPDDMKADEALSDDDRLHKLMRTLHGIGNDVRLRFIQALRDFDDRRSYYKFGFAGLHQYCEIEFGIPRSTAYEYVRVASSLDRLARARTAFRDGKLSWQQVRLITRVATAETEIEWIKLAWDVTSAVLTAEVREAQRTGRNAPRDRRSGMPNLLVRFTCEMTMEEELEVQTAFQNLRETLDAVGGPSADKKPPLVLLAQAINRGLLVPVSVSSGSVKRRNGAKKNGRVAKAGDRANGAEKGRGDGGANGADTRSGAHSADGSGAHGADGTGTHGSAGIGESDGQGEAGRTRERPSVSIEPTYKIVYYHNTDTGETTVDTKGGRVAVSEERLAEIAPYADHVRLPAAEAEAPEPLPNGQIDVPNSSVLSRQVRSRDGQRCSNPGCGSRLGLAAHHIIFRYLGGPTTLTNETTVCGTCHSLIHNGLLEVSGSPTTGLVWRRLPRSIAVRVRDVQELHSYLADLQDVAPEPWARQVGPPVPTAHPDAVGSRVVPDPRLALMSQIPQYTRKNVRFLATGLSNMGLNRAESEELIREAFLLIAEQAHDEGKTGADFEACFGEAAILLQAFRLHGSGMRGT